MVIDDTLTDRYIAEHYLKNYQFAANVILQESATDALNYLMEYVQNPQELPGIIFLDIRMPGMDGFDFLEEYEKLPATVHQLCKIFMLSSSMDPSDLERINNNRFVSGFISKPLNDEKLNGL